MNMKILQPQEITEAFLAKLRLVIAEWGHRLRRALLAACAANPVVAGLLVMGSTRDRTSGVRCCIPADWRCSQ
jgi:hypothetical protein